MEFGICPVCDSGYLHLSTNKTLVCDNCHYEENAHERASMIYEDDSLDRVVAPKWDKQPPKKKKGWGVKSSRQEIVGWFYYE